MDAQLVRELLLYEASTGVFRWKKHRTLAGRIAGTINSRGYVGIGFRGRWYQAHRLAWLFVYGEMPNGEVDHINGDRGDNRICNLRVLTAAENRQNLRRAKRSNKVGLLGVSRRANGRYFARIKLNGVKHHLGSFDTAEAAHEAYVQAKRALHPGNTL